MYEVGEPDQWTAYLVISAYVYVSFSGPAVIGVGDGAGRARAPKIRGKYYSGNYHVKFWHFSGKNRVKQFVNFVNFGSTQHTSCKIRAFYKIFHTYIIGQKCIAHFSPKSTELLRLCLLYTTVKALQNIIKLYSARCPQQLKKHFNTVLLLLLLFIWTLLICAILKLRHSKVVITSPR